MRDAPDPTPFGAIAALDRLVHSPARLAILTALSAHDLADFTYLLRLTGLTKGNLSANLAKLEAGKLVEVVKRIEARKTRTTARLTADGRRAIDAYWQQMERLRDAARSDPGALATGTPSRPEDGT